jgi:hypothetical protein
MSIQEVKYELIERITNSKDIEMLNAFKAIKEKSATLKDWYLELNEAEKAEIDLAEKQHQTNETLTIAEFWKGLK